MSEVNLNKQSKASLLAKMGMMVAISIVLVTFIHFPIFPVVGFLEYDPADIPILIGTFAFGPLGGLVMTVVTSVIQGLTVSAQSGPYGIIMHIIATGTFVLVAGLIYRNHKSKKKAIIALIAGVLAMTAIMLPANLIITPIFMGLPRDAVVALLPFILAFNFVKAGIRCVYETGMPQSGKCGSTPDGI